MNPVLDEIFRSMADQVHGTLSVVRVTISGNLRLRYDPPVGPPTLFSLSVPSSVHHSDMVEVRVSGQLPVTMTAVPSAVLAVALR